MAQNSARAAVEERQLKPIYGTYPFRFISS
jgi:hypothetical protein